MTLNEALSLTTKELLSLNQQELKKVLQYIGRDVNRRQKHLKEQGYKTPATQYLEQSGGKITTRGKTLNELRKEYVRAKQFMFYTTSSVRGAKKTERKFIKAVGADVAKMSKTRSKKFWKTYRKLEEMNGGDVNAWADSKTVVAVLYDEMTKSKFKNIDNALDAAQKFIDDEYERKISGIPKTKEKMEK